MHFKTKHSASDCADLLNITPKALAKITKNNFNKTITNLISERISPFFKNNTDVLPQIYRDTAGFAREKAK